MGQRSMQSVAQREEQRTRPFDENAPAYARSPCSTASRENNTRYIKRGSRRSSCKHPAGVATTNWPTGVANCVAEVRTGGTLRSLATT